MPRTGAFPLRRRVDCPAKRVVLTLDVMSSFLMTPDAVLAEVGLYFSPGSSSMRICSSGSERESATGSSVMVVDEEPAGKVTSFTDVSAEMPV